MFRCDEFIFENSLPGWFFFLILNELSSKLVKLVCEVVLRILLRNIGNSLRMKNIPQLKKKRLTNLNQNNNKFHIKC